MKWRFKYFEPHELLSPDGMALYARGVLPIDANAILKLEKIRGDFNTPFFVNHGWLQLRGFRSPRENFSIYKDNRYSFHFWCAFDVTQDKFSPKDFFDLLRNKKEEYGIGGLGLYESSNFVHIDFRKGNFATWLGK